MSAKIEAGKAMREADQKRKIDEYIAARVASWPTPSPEISMRVAMLLRGGRITPAPRIKTERDHIMDELKSLREGRSKLDAHLREAMDGCRGCGLIPRVHGYQASYGTGFHDHEPQSPDELIQTARSFKPKFAKVDKKISELESKVGITK